MNDSTTYTIGVGRRFTDRFSASARFIYEPERDNHLVSPLAPTNGMRAIGLGATYRVDQIEVAVGVRYTRLSDARAPKPAPPDTARTTFEDNAAVTVGLRSATTSDPCLER